MPLARTLRAHLQPFDSGKLAPRVGNVVLSEGETIDDDAVAGMIESAAADDFDFVWIESRTKLDTTLLDYRGTIVELQGDRDEALSKINIPGTQCACRPLEIDSDGVIFEQLLRFAAESRFTTDPRISDAAFRQHKLALLQGHIANRQGVITFAYWPDDPARPIGYTCTSINEQAAHVYDLSVDPDFQRANVARTLLVSSLTRFASLHPEIRRFMARIYDDNIPCLRLMRSIGFADTGRLFHYYHCWPKVSR